MLKLSKKLLNKGSKLTQSDLDALHRAALALNPLEADCAKFFANKRLGVKSKEVTLTILGDDDLAQMRKIYNKVLKQVSDATFKYEPRTLNKFLLDFSQKDNLEKLYNIDTPGASITNVDRSNQMNRIALDLSEIYNDRSIPDKKAVVRGCLLEHRKALGKFEGGRLATSLNMLLETPALQTGHSKSADIDAFRRKVKPKEPSAFARVKRFFSPNRNKEVVQKDNPPSPRKGTPNP